MIIKIILSIILIMGIINPKISWMIKEGWRLKGAEPSPLFIKVNRISSIVLLVLLWIMVPS